MKELKSKQEIRSALNKLDDKEQLKLYALTYALYHTDNEPLKDELIEVIDEDYLYPNRWSVFEQLTDTELIYDEDDVDSFIDTCIALYLDV